MSQIARLFADTFARFGGADSNTLHVYDDGYVMSIACTAERHLRIREILLQEWQRIEEARSGDGFLSVFVIHDDSGDPLHPIFVAATDGFKDHRLDDLNTIDSTAEWFERSRHLVYEK